MTVKKTGDGAIVNKDCPINRIRITAERSDGRLMVSIDGQIWNITKEQYKKLESFMQEW